MSSATRSGKSQAAFRTISEVADELDVAQHVLRFWESKFPQVRPLKRGGGRRYYRPEDIDLLRDIRSLLYDEGYTIKGAQKLLRQRRAKTPAPGRPTDGGPPQAELVATDPQQRADHPAGVTATASEPDNTLTPPEAGQPPAPAPAPAAPSPNGSGELARLQRLRAELQALRTRIAAALDPGDP